MDEKQLEPTMLAQLKFTGQATQIPLEKIGTAAEAAFELTEAQRSAMDHGHSCGSPDGPDLELMAYKDDPQKAGDLLQVTPEEVSSVIHNMEVLLGRIETGVMASSNSYWPKDCHPDHPGYSVYYWVDYSTFPERFFRPVTQEEVQLLADVTVWGGEEFLFDTHLGKPMFQVANWMKERSYARHGLRLVEVKSPTILDSVDIAIRAATLSNGWLGFGDFPIGSCSHVSNIRIRKNSNYNPGLHQFNWLDEHEVGHSVGLGHTRSNECNFKDRLSYCNATPGVGFYDPSTMNVPASLVNGRKKDRSIVTLNKLYEGVPLPELVLPATPEDPSTLHLPKNNPNGVVSLGGKLWNIWLE